MSLVDIWPSTVIRSNEPATAARRARVGLGDDGVGLDEAEHRREARLDHPRALGLGGDGDAAGAHACSASGPRSVVMIASREVVAAVAARAPLGRLARRPSTTASIVERHADHAGLGDRDRARLDAERLGGRVPHREGVAVALLAGGGVGVAGVDDHGADRAAVAVARGRPAPARRRAALRVRSSAERDLGPRRRRAGRRRCRRRP